MENSKIIHFEFFKHARVANARVRVGKGNVSDAIKIIID